MKISGCLTAPLRQLQQTVQRALKPLQNFSHIALPKITYFASVIIHYQKLGLKIVKISLKVTVYFCSNLAKKVEKIILGIALWSISLKLFFEFPAFYEKSKKFEKSLKTKDREEIGWATFNLAMKPCKILDAILTLGKSVNKLIELTWLQLFQIATTPLSVLCLSFRFFKRIYKIIVLTIEYREMNRITKESGLIAYLDKKIGLTSFETEEIQLKVSENWKVEFNEQKIKVEENQEQDKKKLGIFKKSARKEFIEDCNKLQSLKTQKLSRRVHKEIIVFMKKARKHFRSQDNVSEEERNLVLHDIKKLFLRRTVIDAGKALFVIAEAIVEIAVLIFKFYNATFLLAFSITKTVFNTFKTLYIENRMHVGLKKPEFYSIK